MFLSPPSLYSLHSNLPWVHRRIITPRCVPLFPFCSTRLFIFLLNFWILIFPTYSRSDGIADERRRRRLSPPLNFIHFHRFFEKNIKVFFSYKATLAWPRFKFKSVDVFLNRVRSSANIICPVDHIANGERGRDREQREKDEEKALHFLKPRRG